MPGDERVAGTVELAEPGHVPPLDPGDLVLGIGLHDEGEVLDLVDRARDTAGLVVRRPHAEADGVVARCSELGLPLLAVPDGVGWSALVRLLRAVLDQSARDGSPSASEHVYSDLFDVADTISAIDDAPVTIEDAQSRVLAYSTGQHDVDEARMSTIVGRQVPREVREHFRALGVFRRLARSDEPVYVPAGADGTKPRFIVPVSAGGEWLGSIWAVVDEPVDDTRSRDLRGAAEVVALHLLRLRAQGQLHRQVQLDQVRAALLGQLADRPDWLGDGPWRVVALGGPGDLADIGARCELWVLLGRRFGWRQPLVADLDATPYAIVRADGTEPGSWAWVAELVGDESRSGVGLGCAAGGPVATPADLAESRAQAAAVARVQGDRRVVTLDDAWAEVVLGRAVHGLRESASVSPVVQLLREPQGGALVATLEAVIDHWGEPQRAAKALGVHPNTVRNRLARLTEISPLDLHDPRQRLAVRLEIARLRADGALG